MKSAGGEDERTTREHSLQPAWGAAIAFALVLGYVIVRYVLFRGGPVGEIPASYLANKVLAVGGLILFVSARFARTAAVRKSCGELSFAALGLHLVLSILLFGPRLYPVLYRSSGAMTWCAEVAILAGLLGWIALVRLFLRFALAPRAMSPPPARRGRLGLGDQVLQCCALHCLALGLPGWFAPARWPGHLPPLTLIAFAVALASLSARPFGRLTHSATQAIRAGANRWRWLHDHRTFERRRGHDAT